MVPGPEWSAASHTVQYFFQEFGSAAIKSLGGLVSVRVGLKGTGIDDSLVVHQLETFLFARKKGVL